MRSTASLLPALPTLEPTPALCTKETVPPRVPLHRNEREGSEQPPSFGGPAPRSALLAPPSCILSLCSRVWRFATPGTAARRAPLSMGFSRQGHCSGLPCPPPGHLPNPGIKPRSLATPALPSRVFTTSATSALKSLCVGYGETSEVPFGRVKF